MIDKINMGSLGKITKSKVNQWDWETMIKSRGTIKLKKCELNRGHLGI